MRWTAIEKYEKPVPFWDRFLWWFFLIFGGVTRFAYLNHPKEVVFDEAHFGKFTNWYCCRRQTFWDIHPPFGKLILAAFAHITSWHGHQDFKDIGEKFMDEGPVLIRIAPAFFGMLLPPLMYSTMRTMKRSPLASSISASLVLFELSIICESKFILTDSFLFFFCQLALFSFICLDRIEELSPANRSTFDGSDVVVRREGEGIFTLRWWAWLIFCGTCMGLMLSIKWVAALATYGLSGVYTGIRILGPVIRSRRLTLDVAMEFIYKAFFLIFIPIFIYYVSWYFHFWFSPLPTFGWWQHTNAWHGMSFFEKVAWLNKDMYSGNAGMLEPHQHQSWFYTWPIMYRHVGYWGHGLTAGRQQRINCMGNPFCYWTTLFGLILFVGYFTKTTLRLSSAAPASENENKPSTASKSSTGTVVQKNESPNAEDNLLFLQSGSFLFSGWFLNLVPFFTVYRSCFIYHYIPALLYAMMLFGSFIDRPVYTPTMRKWISVVVLSLLLFGYVFWAPIIYGFTLTEAEMSRRMWLKTWEG